MPEGAFPGLSAVVLTYLGGVPAVDLVKLLIAAGLSPSQVKVVQNAATGRLVLPHDDVTILKIDLNVGYAAGMNAGIRRCLSEGATRILLVTHDARPAPGCIGELMAAFDAHIEYGVLAPVLRSRDARLPFSAGGYLDESGTFAHNLELAGIEDGIKPVDWVDGSIMLVRSDVFTAVGLFDERFFMYCDDVEICLRARRSGWRVGVVAAAEAHQTAGIPRRPGAFAYLNTRNGLEVVRQAGGARAVARTLGRIGRHCWALGRVSFGPNSTEEDRRSARITLRATLEGVSHYALGRWGPPREGLPGLGDIIVRQPGRSRR